MVVNVAGMANNGTCIAHREGLSIGTQSWILLLLVIVWPAKATPAVHSHVQPIKLLSEPTSSWWNVYRTHTLVCSCYDSVTQCGHTPCRLECVCCMYLCGLCAQQYMSSWSTWRETPLQSYRHMWRGNMQPPAAQMWGWGPPLSQPSAPSIFEVASLQMGSGREPGDGEERSETGQRRERRGTYHKRGRRKRRTCLAKHRQVFSVRQWLHAWLIVSLHNYANGILIQHWVPQLFAKSKVQKWI